MGTGIPHFQCWELGVLCLSSLGMGFFKIPTGNEKKKLKIGICEDIMLMNGIS